MIAWGSKPWAKREPQGSCWMRNNALVHVAHILVTWDERRNNINRRPQAPDLTSGYSVHVSLVNIVVIMKVELSASTQEPRSFQRSSRFFRISWASTSLKAENPQIRSWCSFPVVQRTSTTTKPSSLIIPRTSQQ